MINDNLAILIKHSSKRLPPWQFTFMKDQLDELSDLKAEADAVWLVLVCGSDGMVALSESEFGATVGPIGAASPFVRVDRGPRTMYHVFGNAGRLAGAKPNGVAELARVAQAMRADRG